MPLQNPARQHAGHAARIGVIITALALCYAAGLDSLFLFDDAPNLGALAFIQDVPPFSPDFWEFVFGGNAGPAGRPLALFTFALQAGAWPGNPLAFKAVNLVIHSLNATLVYLISSRLLGVLQKDKPGTGKVAMVIALVWALHPVHTSTVLYTVQRMALLSNGFMLLGIYAWLRMRLALHGTTSLTRLCLLTLALSGPGLLALLSKENAPSLVFYVLTLEFTLLRGTASDQHYRRWRLVCLWLPALIVLLAPLFFLDTLRAEYTANFTYTPWQRLLTESRILWQYLGVLFLPLTENIGIFRDVPVSVSLIAPLSTLSAVLAWLACLVFVLVRPDRLKLLPFTLFWFLSGHIVESTILPLEFFFHHRSYLASFGVIFTLVHIIAYQIPARFLQGRVAVAICCLYLSLLALNTFRISTFWSDPLTLAQRWYEGSPDTRRNAEFYGIQLAGLGAGGEQLAAGVFRQAIADHDDSFRFRLNLMILACVNPAVEAPPPAEVMEGIPGLSANNRDLVSPVQQLVTLHINGNCRVYDSGFFVTMLERLIGQSAGWDKGMYQFDLARLQNRLGERERSLALLDSAWDNTGDPGVLVLHAIQLGEAGRFTQAVDKLDLAISEVQRHNDVSTGTRRTKLLTLEDLRTRTVAAMNAGNTGDPNTDE